MSDIELEFQDVLREYEQRFREKAECLAFSPGRVNLIGEHIDYNGGHVFPCALSIGTWAAAGRRSDRKIRFLSLNFRGVGVIDLDLDQLSFDQRDHWANYPKAMVQIFKRHGHAIEQGFNIVVNGNLPSSSGLSSSASIEVLTGVILRELYQLEGLDMERIALLAQEAENLEIGVKCGIMDQYAIAMGKENMAMLLNTATLDCRYAPLNLGDYSLVIASSNKKRGLAGSAYNERRSECEAALKDLQCVKASLEALCELSVSEFNRISSAIKSPVALKRARHAVSEEERTLATFDALNRGDLSEVGRFMNESHLSLRNDYEVTGAELDSLVEAAWTQESCLGSRMTGAGFGGCTVSLVRNEAIEAFCDAVGKTYTAQTGLVADFFTAKPSDGARIIERF